MKTLLRQLMERAGGPGGDAWMQQCLSLPPTMPMIISPPTHPSNIPPPFSAPAFSSSDHLQIPLRDSFASASSSAVFSPPSALPISDVSAYGGRMDPPSDSLTGTNDAALSAVLVQQLTNSSSTQQSVNQHRKSPRTSRRSSSRPVSSLSHSAVSSRGRIQKTGRISSPSTHKQQGKHLSSAKKTKFSGISTPLVSDNSNTANVLSGAVFPEQLTINSECFQTSPPLQATESSSAGQSQVSLQADDVVNIAAGLQNVNPLLPVQVPSMPNNGELQNYQMFCDFARNFGSFMEHLNKTVSPLSNTDSGVAHVWLNNNANVDTTSSASSVAIPTVLSVPPVLPVSTAVPESTFKEVLPCGLSPLGFHLPVAVKEKIQNGDYVDIMSLIPSSKDNRFDKKDLEKFADDKSKSNPRNFSNWLHAFCIYASVLGERHPELCCSLFQHVDIILEAYKNFNGLAWFYYDEAFRQKLSVHKSLKWGEKDVGLWLNLLLPQKQFVKATPPATSSFRRGVCFGFNEGHCKWPHSCKYKHECAFCTGNHPASRCFKKVSSSTTPSSRDLFLKSGHTGETYKHGSVASTVAKSADSSHAV